MTKSFKDMSLMELDLLIQKKREKSNDMLKSSNFTSLLKDHSIIQSVNLEEQQILEKKNPPHSMQ